MVGGSIGPLLAADESWNHQVVETHASVGTSDPSWAEKVWLTAAARDGSLQIGFGLGKYTNRNVVDGFAGIARGTEQWTVRGSRALSAAPDEYGVGPIRYEIIAPLQAVRVVLEANDVQPVSFDIVMTGSVPCFTEGREDRRDHHGYRKATDQIRYHQTGTVSGWLEIAGVRTEIRPEDWFASRDRSWGIRPQVGAPIADMEPDLHLGLSSALAIWNPILFERQGGDDYAFFQYHLHFAGPGLLQQHSQGAFEFADGSREHIGHCIPELRFDPATKRLQDGCFNLTMADGGDRVLRFRKVSELGFYLGAGHYHGGDGQFLGSWRGAFHMDGDHVADTSQPQVAARYSQFRDCIIAVEDHVGGGIGWGTCQTYVYGAWPEFGLSGSEPPL